jgi:hypothetical protein
MSIVLFALIGAAIDASVAYWICFGVYCAFYTFRAIRATIKEMNKE